MSQEDTPQDNRKFSDRAKETAARVKQHVKDNRKEYLIGASCLTVGYLLRRPNLVQTINGNGNVAAIVNKSKDVAIVVRYVKARNYVANPVRCVETGIEWASQTEAAEAMGILGSILSRHLNGKLPHANGYHFERI